MGSVHWSDALRSNSLFYKTTEQKAFGRGTAKESQMHEIMNSTAREQESRGYFFLLLFFCAHSCSSASSVTPFLMAEALSTLTLLFSPFQKIDDIWDWVLDNHLQGWDGRSTDRLKRKAWLWKTTPVPPQEERPLAH